MLGLLSVSACGSEVRVSGTGDSGGDGDGDAVVGMKCYDACIEKGVPADDCDAYCTAYGSPTGVEPLSNLVQCMACDGGPCEAVCQDSVLLSYCD